MSFKTIAIWAIVAIIFFVFIMANPGAAGAQGHQLFEGIITFLRALFGG